MTTLVVDAGNTRIKWAISTQGVLDNAVQPAYPKDHFPAFAAEYWATLARPTRVVVANVAGADVGKMLADWVKQAWDIETEFVVPQREACGIRNAYLDPQKLGADRWAGMIAAYRNTQGRTMAKGSTSAARGRKPRTANVTHPVCVIGCGTAITIDVLTASGEHQGGLIVPGLTMMRRALLTNTQDIGSKMGDESSEIDILARDTQGGVNGGTLYTAISVIDRVTTDLAAELGNNMIRVITGGDAPALLPLLAGQYHHEPMLVLQGLAIFATAAPGILPLATLAPDRMPKCGEHRDGRKRRVPQEPPHPDTTENA